MRSADSTTQRRAAFRTQAHWCDKLGSSFTARLCRLLADRLDDRSAFGERVLTWPLDTLPGDLVALRCCGALHYHVRSQPGSDLAGVYPPNPIPDDDTLWAAIRATIEANDAALTAFLDSPPQTNEVSRAGVVLGGGLQVAARWKLPLSLIEIGASAGLNLNLDRFTYDLGNGQHWGDASSMVRIRTEWRGEASPPLGGRLEVESRIGNDQSPLDPAREDDRRRLLSYVWADQTDRLKRTEAALDIATRHPVGLIKADAAQFLAERLADEAQPGTARFVFHTIVLQYASRETRAAIKATLAKAGEAATGTSPLARFSMEHETPDAPAILRLTMWPGGEERVVGHADSHGAWVDWA